MQKKNIEDFLNKVMDLVNCPAEKGPVVKSLKALNKSAVSLGYYFLADSIDWDMFIVAAHNSLRTHLDRLIEGGQTDISIRNTFIMLWFPRDEHGAKTDTYTMEVKKDPTNGIEIAMALLLPLTTIKGVARCELDSCTKYFFQKRRDARFCCNNCRQKAHQQKATAKRARQKRYYKKKEEQQ